MPHIPQERNAKSLLDRIRLCTDLLNHVRYQRDCEAAAPMCLKALPDPLVGLPRSDFDVGCLRRSLIPIIFIIGGPGSGKGVQSELLVKRFGLTHISLGNLIRTEIQADSSVGRFARSAVAAGNLVPTEVILPLLKNAMLAQFEGSHGFLIDGYPRDEAQLVAFEEEVARAHLVIFLEARDSTLARRLAGRGRADDDEDVVANRIAVFHKNTDVLKRACGHRCKVVNAEGDPLYIFSVITAHVCSMLSQWGFKTPYRQCPKGYVPLRRLQGR